MALYDREQHGPLAFLYGGHDAGVCCRMHSAMALWFLGYPAAALERSRSGLSLARELSHTASLANALPFACVVHQLRGDVELIPEITGSLIATSREHGFQQWLAFGNVFEGWVQAAQQGGDGASVQFRAAVAEYRAAGYEFYLPYFLCLLATTELSDGEIAKRLDTVATALAMVDAAGSHLLDAELYRLKGQLLLAGDPGKAPDAEAAYRHAIDVARRQRAKAWELRAAMSLGRLWQRQGKRDEAARLLGEIHGWFTQGFDTPDLKEARALLNELTA